MIRRLYNKDQKVITSICLVSVLLSASVERCFVSHMRDFKKPVWKYSTVWLPRHINKPEQQKRFLTFNMGLVLNSEDRFISGQDNYFWPIRNHKPNVWIFLNDLCQSGIYVNTTHRRWQASLGLIDWSYNHSFPTVFSGNPLKLVLSKVMVPSSAARWKCLTNSYFWNNSTQLARQGGINESFGQHVETKQRCPEEWRPKLLYKPPNTVWCHALTHGIELIWSTQGPPWIDQRVCSVKIY